MKNGEKGDEKRREEEERRRGGEKKKRKETRSKSYKVNYKKFNDDSGGREGVAQKR